MFQRKTPSIPTVALIAVLCGGLIRLGHGAPGDVFDSSAPVMGADPPKTRTLDANDASVSTQTGALQYGFPIAVPPGRLGVQPSLSLTYSSQSGVYGGVAAGWSLSIPYIEVDTSMGTLRDWYMFNDPTTKWVSSMAGGRRLVEVPEPDTAPYVTQAFRAQHDDSFARYEKVDGTVPWRWQVRTTDGLLHIFGDETNINGPFSDYRVPLTRTVDSFGNTVEYFWDRESFADGGGDYTLTRIEYTSNPGASLPHFAEVEFDYDPVASCAGTLVPIGADVNYRTGVKQYRGARKLRTIRTKVSDGGAPWRTVREVALGYNDAAAAGTSSEDCNQPWAPFRQLTSIIETAWSPEGVATSMPPITFDYGDWQVELDTEDPSFGTGIWPSAHGDTAGLTYGTRAPAFGNRWPTVDVMHIDLDGDGRIDRVWSDTTAQGECAYRWARNGVNGIGGFSAAIELPRLPWADEGAGPNGDEHCSLSGQFTLVEHSPYVGSCQNTGSYLAYRFLDLDGDGVVDLVASIVPDPNYYDPAWEELGQPYYPTTLGGTAWPSCTDEPACPVPDQTCMTSAFGEVEDTVFGWFPTQLEPCLLQSEAWSCGDVLKMGFDPDGCGYYCSSEGAFDGKPPDPGGSCGQRGPWELCEQYVWLFYKGNGDGTFAQTPEHKLQPVPLDADSGDGTVSTKAIAFPSHTITDIDGDGLVDAVTRAKVIDFTPGTLPPNWWLVFLNDGDGNFVPSQNGYPYIWTVPAAALPSMTLRVDPNLLPGPTLPWEAIQGQAGHSTMTDVNGDGLADLIHRHQAAWPTPQTLDPHPVQVFFNVGDEFRVVDPTSLPWTGDSQLDPGILFTNFAVASYDVYDPTGKVSGGERRLEHRTVDYDGDGRVDVYTCDSVTGTCGDIHVGGGDTVLGGVPVTGLASRRALEQSMTSPNILPGANGWWWVEEDYIDFNGDGVADFVTNNGGTNTLEVWTDQNLLDGKPPRLLTSIDNGRGVVTEVTYTPSSKELVDSQGMPNHTWLVDDITVKDYLFPEDAPDVTSCGGGVTCIESTTHYDYEDAVWSPDPATGKYGFRGFETVTTTGPSGAVTVQEYGYGVDWSGRLVETQVFPSAGAAPESVNEQTWVAKALFGGTLTTYHPKETRAYVCYGTSTVEDCKTLTQRWRQEVNTWTALDSSIDPTNTPVVWALTDTEIEEIGAPTVDRRNDTRSYTLYADDEVYRLRLRVEERTAFDPAAGTDVSQQRTETAWDPAFLVPTRVMVAIDDVRDNDRVTYRTYDMATGQVVTITKPQQYEEGLGAHRQLAYDDDMLYVVTTTDVRDQVPVPEVDQIVNTTYDYGTGALIVTRGPNFGSGGLCGTYGCPAEGEINLIDGFGRPIERRVGIDDGAGDYTWETVATTSYDDGAYDSNGEPVVVTSQQLLDIGGATWITTETDYDGHGRPIATRDLVASPETWAESTYAYDRAGNMARFTTPNPGDGGVSHAVYEYSYDSLGRPRELFRPYDNDPEALVLAAEIEYQGLTRVRREFANDGGPAAETKLVYDLFDRLREVHERLDDPRGWAITTYQYSPRDEVAYILDPDGVETWLTHNWAGDRILIERGEGGAKNRARSYDYDRNGNMITAVSPVPDGEDPMLYTTSIAYDDLDRVTSRWSGTREMTGDDRDATGAGGFTLYTYDDETAPNGVGRLRQVAIETEGADELFRTTYAYDARGNTTLVERQFDLNPVNAGAAVTDTITQTFAYNAAGQATDVHYGDDEFGVATQTTATYDLRGLPYETQWGTAPAGEELLGHNDRSDAGTVTRRWRIGNQGTQEATWSYDALGRITQQSVRDIDPSTVVRAEQQLTYWDTDDPRQLVNTLDGGSDTISYFYDNRHQLLQVNDTASVLDESFEHSDAGRLSTAHVDGAGPQLVPRDVEYRYEHPDQPEALTSLVDSISGTDFATYTYDEAGNVIARTQPGTGQGGQWTFVYDGDNRQRKVTHPNGDVELYFYDHAGTRVLSVRQPGGGSAERVRLWAGPTEVWYDGGSGAVTKTWAHVSMGTPIARIENGDTLELQYHSTLQHLLVALTDEGEIVAGYAYGPFGEILDQVGSGAAIDSHLRRFNGKEWDDLSGLSYYGFRYYDPLSLTWTQADPRFRFSPDAAYGRPRLMALYLFDLGNPMRYVDPDGLQPTREWTIQIYTVGATNIDNRVGRRIENHLQQKFQRMAPKNVKVNVQKTKITRKEARNLPQTTADTSVIVVMSTKNQGMDAVAALEGALGVNLDTSQEEHVKSTQFEGRGAGTSTPEGIGASVVNTRDMERGQGRSDDQLASFGAALLEHETGHTLGQEDTDPPGGGDMMDHMIADDETPRTPLRHDAEEMRQTIGERAR